MLAKSGRPFCPKLESIQPFTLKPWEKRVQAFNYENAAKQQDIEWDIRVAVSSSARNCVVGIGGCGKLLRGYRMSVLGRLLYSI